MRPLFLFFLTTLTLFGVDSRADVSTPKSPPTAATNPRGEGGKWQMSASTSPTDGAKIITARLDADGPIPSGFGKAIPVLVLRYKAGQITAYIAFDTYLGDTTTEATVTFGHESPETQKWEVSDDGRAAFVAGDALTFLQRLKHVDRLSISVTPHHASPVTATFTTTGVTLVIKALISAGVKLSD